MRRRSHDLPCPTMTPTLPHGEGQSYSEKTLVLTFSFLFRRLSLLSRSWFVLMSCWLFVVISPLNHRPILPVRRWRQGARAGFQGPRWELEWETALTAGIHCVVASRDHPRGLADLLNRPTRRSGVALQLTRASVLRSLC